MLSKPPNNFSSVAGAAKDGLSAPPRPDRRAPVPPGPAALPSRGAPSAVLKSPATTSTSTGMCQRKSARDVTCAAAVTADSQDMPSPQKKTVLTLPTILTLARLAAIPALIWVFYVQAAWAAPVCTWIFIIASLTDYLDGYLARAMNASTPFGAFLDPVADKLMVSTVLILLATRPFAAGPLAGNAWLMPVLTTLIIGREISMSALREWAASLGEAAHKAVAVNSIGKWKTATQMTSLAMLLYCRDGGAGPLIAMCGTAGPALMLVATFLTVYSLAVYLTNLWEFF